MKRIKYLDVIKQIECANKTLVQAYNARNNIKCFSIIDNAYTVSKATPSSFTPKQALIRLLRLETGLTERDMWEVFNDSSIEDWNMDDVKSCIVKPL